MRIMYKDRDDGNGDGKMGHRNMSTTITSSKQSSLLEIWQLVGMIEKLN